MTEKLKIPNVSGITFYINFIDESSSSNSSKDKRVIRGLSKNRFLQEDDTESNDETIYASSKKSYKSKFKMQKQYEEDKEYEKPSTNVISLKKVTKQIEY